MVYVPSPEEWTHFRQIASTLIPPPVLWRSYASAARKWMREFTPQPARSLLPPVDLAFRRMRLERSTLFARDYLVAEVDRGALHSVFGDMDAVALALRDAFLRDGTPAPPVVLIPATGGRAHGQAWRSVLEHEFVHVNQILIGSYPTPPFGRGADVALYAFAARLRAEYEAHVLQLTRWPHLHPPDSALSLDHWCTFRSYTGSLEPLAKHLLASLCAERSLVRVVTVFQNHLDRLFRFADVDVGLAPWFQKCAMPLMKVALAHVAEVQPALTEIRTYPILQSLLDRRLPPTRHVPLPPADRDDAFPNRWRAS